MRQHGCSSARRRTGPLFGSSEPYSARAGVVARRRRTRPERLRDARTAAQSPSRVEAGRTAARPVACGTCARAHVGSISHTATSRRHTRSVHMRCTQRRPREAAERACDAVDEQERIAAPPGAMLHRGRRRSARRAAAAVPECRHRAEVDTVVAAVDLDPCRTCCSLETAAGKLRGDHQRRERRTAARRPCERDGRKTAILLAARGLLGALPKQRRIIGINSCILHSSKTQWTGAFVSVSNITRPT
jgi:hypothetical protein